MSCSRPTQKDKSSTNTRSRRLSNAASPTSSSSSDWNALHEATLTLSSDDDADVDNVTASQINRYSLTNLLRGARSPKDVDIVIPESPPLPSAFERFKSDASTNFDLGLGTVARRQVKKLKTPQTGQASSHRLSPDIFAELPSVLNTSGSRSTNTSEPTDSSTSARTWSIPLRARDTRRAATITGSTRDSPLPVCPSTPSRSNRNQARCLTTPDFISASSPQHLPPSPITRPALEPFRPSPSLTLCSPPPTTSSRCRIFRDTANGKAKGRPVDPTSPGSPEVDLSRVLAPDSSDTPQKDGSRYENDHLDADGCSEAESYDGDLPSQLGSDFDHIGRIQNELNEVNQAGFCPPSPGVSPIGRSSRFFDQHLINSQDSCKSCVSSPPRQPPPALTDSAKRKQLLAELGFEDECEAGANAEDDDAPFSSSPIEIVQGPMPSISKPKRTPPVPKRLRHRDDDDDDDEITFVDRPDLHRIRNQNEAEQLRDIGIVIDDRPSVGLAPLMSSWPRAKRDAFRVMAGLDKSKSRDEEFKDDEAGQTEAWEALLAKQQKKATAIKFPKKKTWLNRAIWKARRKPRAHGRKGKAAAKKK